VQAIRQLEEADHYNVVAAAVVIKDNDNNCAWYKVNRFFSVACDRSLFISGTYQLSLPSTCH
jgi:hypothetical protein